MNTKISKGRDGWEASTEFSISDKRALKIDTRKGSRGLQSTATVVEPTPTGFIWAPFSDFKETLNTPAGLRCTEKTVREEHARALADIEAIKSRALAFYAKKADQAE